ncbi:hypothetical protein PCL_07865 [Purpureocillium lilacinum]|uniref:Uncharacterized protein n=1 Tax=Purpureocillium lilacinum TaxID=33203 RepID=A0A2U3EJ71_PURLI|nr:hypothetical protein PCL_07865 [Purpureocillium lilacinum]
MHKHKHAHARTHAPGAAPTHAHTHTWTFTHSHTRGQTDTPRTPARCPTFPIGHWPSSQPAPAIRPPVAPPHPPLSRRSSPPSPPPPRPSAAAAIHPSTQPFAPLEATEPPKPPPPRQDGRFLLLLSGKSHSTHTTHALCAIPAILARRNPHPPSRLPSWVLGLGPAAGDWRLATGHPSTIGLPAIPPICLSFGAAPLSVNCATAASLSPSHSRLSLSCNSLGRHHASPWLLNLDGLAAFCLPHHRLLVRTSALLLLLLGDRRRQPGLALDGHPLDSAINGPSSPAPDVKPPERTAPCTTTGCGVREAIAPSRLCVLRSHCLDSCEFSPPRPPANRPSGHPSSP